MHVILGLAVLAASLYTGHRFSSATFGGLLHVGSAIILLAAPVGAALIAYDLRTLGACVLWSFRALFGRHGGKKSRRLMLEDLYAFGRAVRAGRAVEASEVLEWTHEPLLHDAGPLVLAKTPGAQVAETVSTLAYARMAEIRSAEEVLKTLSKAAPSFGMVGTIMGLVDVMSNLQDFTKLGPGMALAVMATLYGLVLAQGVYVPLATAVGELGQRTAVASELLGAGLAAIADGRSIYELGLLAGQHGGQDRVATDAATATKEGERAA